MHDDEFFELSTEVSDLGNKVEDLEEELNELKTKLAAAEVVITHARTLVRAGQQRKERTKAFQKAASIARQGGPRGDGVIKDIERKHPTVIDIGDVVADIEEALEEYDKVK